MKIAIVGITELVGSEILKVLEERNFPVDEIIPVALEWSPNKTVCFKEKYYNIYFIEDILIKRPELIFFSSKKESLIHWISLFKQNGSKVFISKKNINPEEAAINIVKIAELMMDNKFI